MSFFPVITYKWDYIFLLAFFLNWTKINVVNFFSFYYVSMHVCASGFSLIYAFLLLHHSNDMILVFHSLFFNWLYFVQNQILSLISETIFFQVSFFLVITYKWITYKWVTQNLFFLPTKRSLSELHLWGFLTLDVVK